MSDTEATPAGQKTIVYATTWCPFCRVVTRWLDSHSISYDYINIEEHEDAAEFVMQVNGGNRTVPTVVFPDGSVETNPNARYLAAKFPQPASK